MGASKVSGPKEEGYYEYVHREDPNRRVWLKPYDEGRARVWTSEEYAAPIMPIAHVETEFTLLDPASAPPELLQGGALAGVVGERIQDLGVSELPDQMIASRASAVSDFALYVHRQDESVLISARALETGDYECRRVENPADRFILSGDTFIETYGVLNDQED
jgi:hypothetical protein